LLNYAKSVYQISLKFLVHDYYSICPMPHLIDYRMVYCGIPDNIKDCENCLQRNRLINIASLTSQNYPDITMRLWRKKFGDLLDASSIVCFSQSSKDILQRAYPGLSDERFEIILHRVDWVRPVTVLKSSRTVNIAILGHLVFHKGVSVVASLASYIDYYELDAKVHLFGEIVEPYESLNSLKSVILHGKYDKNELPDLMEKNEIDLVFIPSICPETFSYTTEEAINMNLPVAVFDLGAPVERVRFYQKGLILLKKEPEYIVREIFDYLEKDIVVEKKKEVITIVCVSNNELMYSRVILSSAFMTEHAIIKYENTPDENSPIPIRYNQAIQSLLESGYSGWIFFVHNDFSVMQSLDSVVKDLDHFSLYGPIGAVLANGEKVLVGEILQAHQERLIYHGTKIESPVVVDTVDCQCLFLHTDLLRKFNLQFDENATLSFHQYVEDFCLNASMTYGVRTYAVPLVCKHLSWGKLNKGFYLAIDYINSKYPRLEWAGTCTHIN
jgi:glycosyltransferase involved in cell wall biosynthesis